MTDANAESTDLLTKPVSRRGALALSGEDFWKVSISDTGLGISPADLALCFRFGAALSGHARITAGDAQCGRRAFGDEGGEGDGGVDGRHDVGAEEAVRVEMRVGVPRRQAVDVVARLTGRSRNRLYRDSL